MEPQPAAAAVTEHWLMMRRQLAMRMESDVSAGDVAGPVCVSCLMTRAVSTPVRLVVHQHPSLVVVVVVALSLIHI